MLPILVFLRVAIITELFCIIPKLRGHHRSRNIESIVSQAKSLAKQGIQEIIFISQITTNYGKDIYVKPLLAKLLNELSKVSIPCIRIHYVYTTGLTDEVIKAFKDSKILYLILFCHFSIVIQIS